MSVEPRSLHRWQVAAEVRIPRARPAVWREWEADEHAAWSQPGWPSRYVEGPTGLVVGSAKVSVTPPQGPDGIRVPVLATVTHVWPGYSRTVEILMGGMEHVETINLADDGPHATTATLHGWGRMECTASHAQRVQIQLQASAVEFLQRAALWVPPTA